MLMEKREIKKKIYNMANSARSCLYRNQFPDRCAKSVHNMQEGLSDGLELISEIEKINELIANQPDKDLSSGEFYLWENAYHSLRVSFSIRKEDEISLCLSDIRTVLKETLEGKIDKYSRKLARSISFFLEVSKSIYKYNPNQ
jgi:hypothetical protein